MNPTSQGKDQIVQSGNYCYSTFRVASMEENKIQPSKDYHDSCPNHIALRTGKKKKKKKGACPAEVGALAPAIEKSATELKI